MTSLVRVMDRQTVRAETPSRPWSPQGAVRFRSGGVEKTEGV